MKHIKAGEPIRASLLNSLIDETTKQPPTFSGNKTGLGTVKGFHHSNVLVRILNETGENLNRFAVVALSEPIFEPDNDVFFQEPAFRGLKPNNETKNFAILQTPALQGEIVLGCVAGISIVKIDVQNESDELVTPKDETLMQSSSEGVARIIWKESGTGEKWGLILYPVGGGGETKIYAVVMSAIKCPPDPTLDPDDEDFRNSMGEIKIEGKTYEPEKNENGEPITDENGDKIYHYDKCACRELAGKEDEFPEQLVKGRQIEVIYAGQYDNPDYEPPDDDDDDEPDDDVPEKLDWYLAINTAKIYNAKLNSDVDAGESTTFNVADSDGEIIETTVWASMADEDTYWKSEAESFDIERRETDEGRRLVIVDGRCPIPKEDPEESENPPEPPEPPA
ncbi:MAG: hypothetical protein LBP59_04815 [Planctomycetaceae bacterium]|nr:hypothetical protein [Planctomycetaceae bacterium]